MNLTRKRVIEILEKVDFTVYKEPKTKTAQALEYAISSLKTDEAYQIMYEGGEIFTKADMVAMLTEIQAEIENLDLEDSIPSYTRGAEDTRDYIANMIEERIDKLKGVKDGNDD